MSELTEKLRAASIPYQWGNDTRQVGRYIAAGMPSSPTGWICP